MAKTKTRHYDPLMGLKCEQHVERMIIETIQDYPSLQDRLAELVDKGGKYIRVSYKMDNLKPCFDIEGDKVILYV